MIYQTEKQLKDLGDKVPADAKSKIEAGMQSLRDAIAKDDLAAMKSGIESLRQETMAMGQAIYSQVRLCWRAAATHMLHLALVIDSACHLIHIKLPLEWSLSDHASYSRSKPCICALSAVVGQG